MVSTRRSNGCCHASCGLIAATTITTAVVIPVVLNPELQAFLVNVGPRKGSRPSLAMSQRLDELRGTPMEQIISELETSLQRYPPIKPGTPDPYVSPK